MRAPALQMFKHNPSLEFPVCSSRWACWAGTEWVRALAVPWLGARLCPRCSCMARVKTEDRKSAEALGYMGLHLFSLLTLQQKVDNCFL